VLCRLVLAGLAVLLALVSPVSAEHEVFYRYSVLGYVKNAQGKPVRDAKVEVVRAKTGLLYVSSSDANGFYVVVMRLGDESAGEALRVRQGQTLVQVTASFDPSNHADERGTRVDFEAGRAIERTAWFRSTLLNVIGVTRH
jgi:hypothetical protein